MASQDEQHRAAHFTTQIWIQNPTVPQRQVRGCLAWASFRTISVSRYLAEQRLCRERETQGFRHLLRYQSLWRTDNRQNAHT